MIQPVSERAVADAFAAEHSVQLHVIDVDQRLWFCRKGSERSRTIVKFESVYEAKE